MLMVQEKISGNWNDVRKCDDLVQAKEYIKRIVMTSGKRAENYRVIMLIAHCVTNIEFIDDATEEERKPEEIEKDESSPNPKKLGAPQTYSDDQLKLLYFKRSCELKCWAKTSDFPDPDKKYPTWFTYRNRLGSVTNVKDMVIQELRKDPILLRYRETIDQYYTHGKERHTGVYVLKKLNEGTKGNAVV